MSLFPHREYRYYGFALKAGLANLVSNGFRLGLKRTIGKISQPINWYTRFPEYHYFDEAITNYLRQVKPGSQAKLLDIGSPKNLGLYLAFREDVASTLTDISELNIDEYRLIWRSMSSKAKGEARFELRDARDLGIPDCSFDVVYSMSVIEHIEGASGDSIAVREMLRVLKPGGLFVISVPFGPEYIEQEIVGLAGAVRPTNDRRSYFFQRIYDEKSFNTRILDAATGLENTSLKTVWRKHMLLHRTYASFGHEARGFVGFLNPMLSVIGNRSCAGMRSGFPTRYGSQHSLKDVYGDLIMSAVKKSAT